MYFAVWLSHVLVPGTTLPTPDRTPAGRGQRFVHIRMTAIYTLWEIRPVILFSPQVTLNISAPWGINAGVRGGSSCRMPLSKRAGGVLHAGCCCQNLGSCVFFFPFWGRLYCVLDTRHESFVMFFVMFSGFCLSVQLTPPISSDVLVRSSSLQRPRKHMQLSYSIVPAEKCQGINAA